MGGLLIRLPLWCQHCCGCRCQTLSLAVLLVVIAFGVIGSVDDWMKLRRQSHNGMSARMKMGMQLSVGFVATLAFVQLSPEALRYGVAVPFLKDTLISMGILYVPFAVMVIGGTSNTVNLTDGLDGLAIVR